MKKFKFKYGLICVVITGFCFNTAAAQKGYAADSLQIKAYTSITYRNTKVKEIKLLKVFCDYCNDKQLESVGNQAIIITEGEKYKAENRLENGTKKLALFIRVSKKDFQAIKDD